MQWLSSSFYYIKEPLYWLGSAYIYNYITHSVELTLLVYDALCILLIIQACKNFKLPVFFVFLYYSCFPSFLGYENVLRQFIASCFVVYALSVLYVMKPKIKRLFLLTILPFLTHNVTILFAPIIFFRKKAIWIISLLFIFILMYFFASQKSASFSDGRNLTFIYVVFLSGVAFYLYLANFKDFATFLLIASIVLFAMFPDGRFERFAMLLIQASSPFICLGMRIFKRKVFIKMATFFLLSIPVLLFSSTYNFLLDTLQ